LDKRSMDTFCMEGVIWTLQPSSKVWVDPFITLFFWGKNNLLTQKAHFSFVIPITLFTFFLFDTVHHSSILSCRSNDLLFPLSIHKISNKNRRLWERYLLIDNVIIETLPLVHFTRQLRIRLPWFLSLIPKSESILLKQDFLCAFLKKTKPFFDSRPFSCMNRYQTSLWLHYLISETEREKSCEKMEIIGIS
jgi:hypothetical protein